MQSCFRVKALGLAVLLGAVVALSFPASTQADDKTAGALKDTSATQVPADAAFYYASLRNKDQLDRLFKSNAYKTLKGTQAFKLALTALKQQAEEAGLPPAIVDRLFSDKAQKNENLNENEQFANLVIDALADDVFIYGGKTFNDLLNLYTKVQSANTVATYSALGEGKFEESSKAGLRAMLDELQKGRDSIKVPELVIGMKTKEPKKFVAHAERLEKLLANVFDNQLKGKGKVKRDGGLVTIEADGSAIQWDDIPWDENAFGAKKEDYQKLFDHLKKLTLTVSVGVKGDYLLFALGSSTKELDQFGGKGKSLVDREELAPIAKHSKEKVTAVAYYSKDFMSGLSGSGGINYDEISKGLKGFVEKQVKKADTKKGLNSDIDELLGELKKWRIDYGAVMGFSFMTAKGYEYYTHHYSKHDYLKDVRTNLFEHVGGDPIFASSFGCKVDGSTYAVLSKLSKSFYGHGETIFLDSDAPQDNKDEYKKVSKAILPMVNQLDEIIAKKFLPSLKGNSGLGIVIDGKWTSKRWQKDMPEAKKALPMLQPAVLMTVNDADKFVDAMQAFRVTVNDIYAKIRDLAPNAPPEFKIPAPNTLEKGKMFSWPVFKDTGLDEQVELVAGVQKGVATLAFSKSHAEAIMKETKLAFKDGPLVEHNKTVVGGTLLNFAKLADVVLAWVDATPDLVPADAPEDVKKQAVATSKQVREIALILKCFREYQSASYLAGGTLVTHARAVFQDLEESVEPK